ncbi:helix-turn-helix domain-containing protein [Pseudaeromonas pectinilytica]
MARSIKPLATPSLDLRITPALLGEAVRARRTQTGLTLHDAAALCGVARDTLMKLEHGTATIQLGSVLQVCAGLGIQLQIVPWQDGEEHHDEWC